jgi:hypothetical protein
MQALSNAVFTKSSTWRPETVPPRPSPHTCLQGAYDDGSMHDTQVRQLTTPVDNSNGKCIDRNQLTLQDKDGRHRNQKMFSWFGDKQYAFEVTEFEELKSMSNDMNRLRKQYGGLDLVRMLHFNATIIREPKIISGSNHCVEFRIPDDVSCLPKPLKMYRWTLILIIMSKMSEKAISPGF